MPSPHQRAHVRRLRYRPPFAWEPLLSFLAARAIPGVECVADGSYRRTIEIDGQPGAIEVRPEVDRDAVTLRAWLPDRDALPQVVERVRRVFDLDADPEAIGEHLASDPVLASRVQRVPGLRVPGAWDPFELGIRAILGQQVTVKGASTLAGRLVLAYGRVLPSVDGALTHLFPSAADLARADLSTLGVPSMRRATLLALARAVADGSVAFTHADLAANLVSLPGIGDWTAQYVLMRACGDRDAFPASDLWLRRSAGAASTRALVQRAEAWRPYRAYAAMYLWQGGE
jgi:AraC family transcriptional regulator of adaptative response / DNA-3-methyladenine glycosylase II